MVYGATLIKGPKGCGKTTSAKPKAKSYVEFQDEEVRDNLLAVAETAPKKLLIGKTPVCSMNGGCTEALGNNSQGY